GIGDTSPIIKPVTMNALIGLLEELVKIHGLAYAWSAELDIHRLLHDLGTTTVRTYIRATLEALDIRYLYQEDIVPETKELVACTLEEDKSFFAEPEDKE
ncbi:MAG: hypothetical protein PHR60_06790, partial [Eubacteriales bacterium]|nr:hypothetical protein [Eubacteriales bacterium]